MYCLEQEDNGENLASLYIDTRGKRVEEYTEDIYGGTNIIRVKGKRAVRKGDDKGSLYTMTPVTFEDVMLTFVPYCYWGNRTPGEMMVWVKYI